MEKNQVEIELHSEDVKDIISYVPNWMIRWGNILILALILLFVLGLFLIKYPETIYCDITITTSVPPAKIVSRSSGILVEVFVKENQLVKKEQILAVIENSGNYDDILKLRKLINSYDEKFLAFLSLN